jgi:isoleucyl-tRNA synthetase
VAAELNVETVESFASAGDLVDHAAKGNFRTLGRRFGKRTPDVAAAVAAGDAARMAAELEAGDATTVEVEGESVALGADEVIITERPREGWSVVNDQGETIALDLDMTPELVRAGLAREVIRLVQEARKASGFDVADRITLAWSASGEVAAALEEHLDLVAGEVLAVEVTRLPVPGDGWQTSDLGLSFAVAVARSAP